jgi:BirA family transcriptional regulator, biotin operon repressor / biotin---[acetyl-CoA-carboxylase] ligase
VTEVDRATSVPVGLADGLDHARAHGDPSPIGSRVLYFPIASSTNDLAAKLAAQGTPDGTLIIAGQQTAGRGRGGHHWYSPPGAGLYVSVVLDAQQGTSGDWVHALTLATGVAMAEGLHAASGLPVMIKWPNDLVMAPAGTVRGARKLAGILAEAQSDGGALSHVIVGVGVNVGPAAWPADISSRATSLEEELGRPVDSSAVLGASLARMGTWVRRLRAGHSAVVRARWQQLAVGAAGATVEIAQAGGLRRGVTAGIDDDGALLVRHGTGTERVVGGEVTWL